MPVRPPFAKESSLLVLVQYHDSIQPQEGDWHRRCRQWCMPTLRPTSTARFVQHGLLPCPGRLCGLLLRPRGSLRRAVPSERHQRPSPSRSRALVRSICVQRDFSQQVPAYATYPYRRSICRIHQHSREVGAGIAVKAPNQAPQLDRFLVHSN